MRLQVSVLLGVLLVACATMPPETAYNRGVDAYKMKHYTVAAAEWAKAVDDGDTTAMNNLGYLLYYGYGVDKDVDRAVRLWRAAAYAGESEAQMHLGTAYGDGVGVERSLSVAYAWYQCAIQNASKKTSIRGAVGDTEAEILKDTKADLEKLSGDIAATDLERGKILAVEFIARYGKSGP